jgi:hypothetical protein
LKRLKTRYIKYWRNLCVDDIKHGKISPNNYQPRKTIMFSIIKTSALANLSHLHSFIKGELLQEHDLELGNFGGGEELIGVYINTPEDYILITSIGLRWSHQGVEIFIPYKSIKEVEATFNENEGAHLHLTIHDEEIHVVPVLNATEDFPDIESMHDFLSAVIVVDAIRDDDPTAPSLTPGDVSSRQQLTQVLSYYSFKCTPDKRAYLMSIMQGLEDNYPPRWLLREVGIDENILESPDLWRLLALLLTFPVRPEKSIGDAWKISFD